MAGTTISTTSSLDLDFQELLISTQTKNEVVNCEPPQVNECAQMIPRQCALISPQFLGYH